MDWPLQKKLAYVTEKVPSILPGQVRKQFAGLMPALSLAIKLEAMAYSELFGVAGQARIAMLNEQAFCELAHPTMITVLAAAKSELEEAAINLAEVFSKASVAALLNALAKCEIVGGGGTARRAPPAAPPAPPQIASPPPRRSAPPKPLPEEPVFLPNIDAAAMAAAMRAAAQSGTPFCLE
jgi:hypothetical protein